MSHYSESYYQPIARPRFDLPRLPRLQFPRIEFKTSAKTPKAEIDPELFAFDIPQIESAADIPQAFQAIDTQKEHLFESLSSGRNMQKIEDFCYEWLIDNYIAYSRDTFGRFESLWDLDEITPDKMRQAQNDLDIKSFKRKLKHWLRVERLSPIKKKIRSILGASDPDRPAISIEGTATRLRFRGIFSSEYPRGRANLDAFATNIRVLCEIMAFSAKLQVLENHSVENVQEAQILNLTQELHTLFDSLTDPYFDVGKVKMLQLNLMALLHTHTVQQLGVADTIQRQVRATFERVLAADSYYGDWMVDWHLIPLAEVFPLIIAWIDRDHSKDLREYFHHLPPEEKIKLLHSPITCLPELISWFDQHPSAFQREIVRPEIAQLQELFKREYGVELPYNFRDDYEGDSEEEMLFKKRMDALCKKYNLDFAQLCQLEAKGTYIANPVQRQTSYFEFHINWHLIQHGTPLQKKVALNGLQPGLVSSTADLSYRLAELGNKTGYQILVEVMKSTDDEEVAQIIAYFWSSRKSQAARPLNISLKNFGRDSADYIYLSEILDRHGFAKMKQVDEAELDNYYQRMYRYLQSFEEGQYWYNCTPTLTNKYYLEALIDGVDVEKTLSDFRAAHPRFCDFVVRHPRSHAAEWFITMLTIGEKNDSHLPFELAPRVADCLEKLLIAFPSSDFADTLMSDGSLRLFFRKELNYLELVEFVLSQVTETGLIKGLRHLPAVFFNYEQVMYTDTLEKRLAIINIIQKLPDTPEGVNKISAILGLFKEELKDVVVTPELFAEFEALIKSFPYQEIMNIIRYNHQAGVLDLRNPADLTLLLKFIQAYGLLTLPVLYKTYVSLKRSEPVSVDMIALGITETGQKGAEQLEKVFKTITDGYALKGDQETILSAIENPIGKDILSHVSRYSTSMYSRGYDIARATKVFYDQVKRNRKLLIIPSGYEVKPMHIRKQRVRENFTISSDAIAKYQEYAALLIEAQHAPAKLSYFKDNFAQVVEKHLQQIDKSSAPDTAKEKQKLIYQLYRHEGLISLIQKADTIGDLIILLLEFASDPQAGFTRKVLLDSNVFKQLLFLETVFLNRIYGSGVLQALPGEDEGIDVDALEEITRVVSTGLLDDVTASLDLDRFSAMSFVRDKVFSTKILSEEIAKSKEIIATTEEIGVHPSRDLRLELSGYVADACWTRTGDIVTHNPNMIGLTFTQENARGVNIIGSCLLIRTHLANGEPAIIIRGINPRENYIRQMDPADFFEQVVDLVVGWEQATAENDRKGLMGQLKKEKPKRVHVIAPPSNSGALSNRPPIQNYFAQTYEKLPQVMLADKVNFNGYNITGTCRVVRTFEC